MHFLFHPNDIKFQHQIYAGFGAGFGGMIISSIVFYCWLRRRGGKVFFKSFFVSGKSSSDRSLMMDPEKGDSFAVIHLFTYNELEEATNNFDSNKELGEGGFGTVYYGKRGKKIIFLIASSNHPFVESLLFLSIFLN